MNLEPHILKLKGQLDPRRFYHSLGVMQTAVCLALRHGIPTEPAAVGGLLHDCARCLNKSQQYERLMEWDVPFPDPDGQYRTVWHAWLSPEYARREYRIQEPEVLEAIRYHTTGAPGMSPLAEVIFVADCIDPTRNYPDVEALRRLARQDLRAAVRECLIMKRDHVEDRGQRLHPDATQALSAYGANCSIEVTFGIHRS